MNACPPPPFPNLIIVLIIQNKDSVAVKYKEEKDEQLVLEAVMVSFKNEHLHFRKARTKGISMFVTWL